MTITAYTGLPGSGKSYGVFENVIVPALTNKKPVWTNIPCHEEKLIEKFGVTPTAFQIDDITKNPDWFQSVFEAGALLVLDECWRLWPAGLRANNVLMQHKSFLAEHRHMVGENGLSTEIVLVTQDLAQISSFARNLVENTFHVTKLSKLGLDKRFRVDVYFGPVTGATPPKSKREREIHGTFKSEIHAFYKSHTMSKTGGAGDESRTDGRFNILKGGMFKSALFSLVVGVPLSLLFLWVTWNKMFGGDQADIEQAAQSPQSQQVQPALTLQQPVTVQPPPTPKKEPDLLSAFRLYIAFYNPNKGPAAYVFGAYNDNTLSLEVRDMKKLGYLVTPINRCLVLLKMGNLAPRPVTCMQREEPRSENLIDLNLSSASTGS
jgi:zona occludens toxin